MIFGLPTPHVDWFALSAPLSLLAAGGVSLLTAVLLPRGWRRPFGAFVCALGFAAAISDRSFGSSPSAAVSELLP